MPAVDTSSTVSNGEPLSRRAIVVGDLGLTAVGQQEGLDAAHTAPEDFCVPVGLFVSPAGSSSCRRYAASPFRRCAVAGDGGTARPLTRGLTRSFVEGDRAAYER
jgi:hypothetical protein